MSYKKSATGLCWLWVTVIVLILDRLTKYFALQYLPPYAEVPVFKYFNLTLAYNKGAAFSFLNSASGWQIWMFGVIALLVSIGLLIWLARLSSRQRWLCIALTLIIGGALGNLSDRFLYGHVIDFLDFYIANWHWPAFNIADSAICVGAVMLFIDALWKKP
ncbi:MAG TPA: signal peptidase II [Gammaproteobacteria bacterium]|nr:signal peptidase II [Gammaproteobacteria bacterium]